jgi:hypothetical protein
MYMHPFFSLLYLISALHDHELFKIKYTEIYVTFCIKMDKVLKENFCKYNTEKWKLLKTWVLIKIFTVIIIFLQ